MRKHDISSDRAASLMRLSIQALALVIIIPSLLIVYQFRDKLDAWDLPAMFFILLVSLLGFYLIWRVLRGINTIMKGLEKISRGDAKSLNVDGEAGQLREMAEIINALNKLTEEFRENASQLERFIQQFATLTELTEITAQIPDINGLLQLVLRKTMASTHARIGTVMLLREEGDGLEIVAAEGWAPASLGPIPLDERHGKTVIETGVPVLVRDIEKSPFSGSLNDRDDFSSSSFLTMPLKAKNSTVGLLSLADKATGGIFDRHDQQFLTVLLAQMGYAVENARLLKQAREAAVNLKKTVHIQEIELQEAQKKVIQTQKLSAVGQLAGGVAHDFNNLLQAIIGYTKLAMKSLPPGASQVRDLERIQKAADRAAALIRKLLAFSRQQVLQSINMDVNRTIDDIVEMVERIIGEHIHLEIVRGSSGVVHADPQLIEQVLVNLCVNARDAMPRGGTIRIETSDVEIDKTAIEDHACTEPGCYVLVTVADEGCGMDTKTLLRIFEPFFTTKEVGKGTGLGLSTVYGIVHQHNGAVDVVSEPDKGTTFKIYLPTTDSPVTLDIPGRTEAPAVGGDEMILVAEDDEIVRELTVQILEDAGYNVLPVTNGIEAIEVFKNHASEISLILLDVLMPKMGGCETYDRLRTIQPEVRLLFTTGYSADNFHTGFIQDQGLQIIHKPHTPDQLLLKVRDVLDGVRAEAV